MADEAAVDDSALLNQIVAREKEVEGHLAKKDKANALKASLQSPPIESKTAEVRVSETGNPIQSDVRLLKQSLPSGGIVSFVRLVSFAFILRIPYTLPHFISLSIHECNKRIKMLQLSIKFWEV